MKFSTEIKYSYKYIQKLSQKYCQDFFHKIIQNGFSDFDKVFLVDTTKKSCFQFPVTDM